MCTMRVARSADSHLSADSHGCLCLVRSHFASARIRARVVRVLSVCDGHYYRYAVRCGGAVGQLIAARRATRQVDDIVVGGPPTDVN